MSVISKMGSAALACALLAVPAFAQVAPLPVPGIIIAGPTSFGSVTTGVESPPLAVQVTLAASFPLPAKLVLHSTDPQISVADPCGGVIRGPEGCTLHIRVRPTVASGRIAPPIYLQAGSDAGASEIATLAIEANVEPTLVSHLHQWLVGSAPDATTVSSQAGWGILGGFGATNVYIGAATQFAQRAGFATNPMPIVERYYRAFLDRAPDAAGKAFWEGLLAEGVSPVALGYAFAQSDEFMRTMAPRYHWPIPAVWLPTESQLVRLAGGLLRRAPTSAELQAWTKRFSALSCSDRAGVKAVLDDITATLIDTPRINQPNELVTDLYGGFFNRAPDRDGFRYWRNRLIAGANPHEVRKAFLDSGEFAARMNAFNGFQPC